jgi:hypothetical protein
MWIPVKKEWRLLRLQMEEKLPINKVAMNVLNNPDGR